MKVIDQQQLEFSRIIELSDLMLKNGQEQQWHAVTELQFLREELMHAFFEYHLEMDNHIVSEGIKHMIDTDQMLAACAQIERDLLQGQIYKMKQGKQAVKAYAG